MALLSFVIPCYRSEKTISAVVDEIRLTMTQRPETDYEIVLTDDCSPDGVWSVIEDMAQSDSHIRAIRFTKYYGQHSALLAGLTASRGYAAICLDDDGQAPVDELFKLVDELEKGYDVVYGTYPEIKQNGFRRFGSWMNRTMAEVLLEWPKGLQATSFLIIRRLIIDEMIKYDKPYPYLEGLITRVTRRIGQVPVQHRARVSGTSGYTFSKLLKLWINGFTAFSVKPLRVSSMCGALMALFGFIYLAVIVITRIVDPTVTEGYSSLMAVILLVGGLIMIMLGLIGEYLGRLYICMNNSPQYVIRQTVDHEDDNK